MSNFDELKEILEKLPEEKRNEIMELANKRAKTEVEEMEKDRSFGFEGNFMSKSDNCETTATVKEEDKTRVEFVLSRGENEKLEFTLTREEFENLATVCYDISEKLNPKKDICTFDHDEFYRRISSIFSELPLFRTRSRRFFLDM